MIDNGITEFFVDESRKKHLKKYIDRSTNEFSGIKKCLQISNILILLLPLLFVVYAYFISNGFVQLHDRYAPEGTKNHLLIITIAIVILVLTYFMRLIIKTIYSGLVSRNIKGRFAETLLYNDGTLEYGYKNYMQASIYDRVIVKIPLLMLDDIIYNSGEKKLTFVGKISSLYYDNYEKMITRGTEIYEDMEFDIFDYFSPSISEFLNEKGLKITKK